MKNIIDVDTIWKNTTMVNPPKNQKRVDQYIRRAVRRCTGLMIAGWNRV